MSASHTMSNIQRELLKLYSADIKEADMINIKRFLATYFASKAINEADKIWEEKGYDNDAMNAWLVEEKTTNDKGNS